MPSAQDLQSPVRFGPYTLANRIVMAPMTRNRAGAGNVPAALNVEYYRQRASAALIVTEATQVSPEGVGYPATPGIHSAAQIAGWRHVVEAVHAAQGRIFAQLWHVGRISHPSLQPNGALPVAPSAIAASGQCMTYDGMKPFVAPRALETHEISGIVAAFRDGAKNALAAGFDGVEIHGASGYLLDQFLQDNTNQRGDSYGGALANRARLCLEVTAAVVAVWGEARTGYRISPFQKFNDMGDSDPEATFGYLTSELNRLGLAYLHVVEMGAPVQDTGPNATARAFLDSRHALFKRLRAGFNGLFIVNGGYDAERGAAVIAAGQADLVSYAKHFLANPDLPRRFAAGAALNEPVRATFYGGDHRGYTDYPALG